MKIVVIEDEIRIREGISKLLEKFFPEHQVVGTAEDGREGLELVRVQQPDLVITDVKMPVMDGLEMLEQIYHSKMKCRAIVLSAYAEFSYAQQAMRWGVSEYLIKPLVVTELVQAVKNVEAQFVEAEKQPPEALGRIDNILFGILFGGTRIDAGLIGFLESRYDFRPQAPIIEVQIYLGSHYRESVRQKCRRLEELLRQQNGIGFCLLQVPKEKMIVAIVYQYQDERAVERRLQHDILLERKSEAGDHGSYGWIVAAGITELKNSHQQLAHHLDWNISLGDAVLISYPKIMQVQTVLCIYPVDIENRLKTVLCAYQYDKARDCIEEFRKYFERGQIYQPKEIKESYIRFLWAMLNVAKEIGLPGYHQVDQRRTLSDIMNAISREELWDAAKDAADKICINEREEAQVSYNVKRAQKMIHEYYQAGITLDEIADKLNLTPEYLGMQFHKELGIKFTAYMKEFRISKAKELLIGSSMKVLEIAERIGYSDPKYFSRVFKESTGQLPAEYRKANK